MAAPARHCRWRALVIETAFGDDEHALADASASTCARRSCSANWRSWTRPREVHITHIKPGEVDAVMSEIAAQVGGRHRISALVSGQVMTLPG